MKLRHLTEDKFLFWVTTLVGTFLVLIFLIVGIIGWGLFRIFDPNFVEYGPFFAFYSSRECALSATDGFDGPNGCKMISGHGVGDVYKNNPPSIQDSLNQTLSASDLSGYPKGPTSWQCSFDGKVIENSDKLLFPTPSTPQQFTDYKCWPR